MSRVNDLMIEVDRRRAESSHTTATALDAQRGFSEREPRYQFSGELRYGGSADFVYREMTVASILEL